MGRLVIIPTPIGNLEDITLRSIRMLKGMSSHLCGRHSCNETTFKPSRNSEPCYCLSRS